MIRKKLHFIQSLARGIAVLQAFSAERPVLTLSEISRITGMNTTAVQRFTDTWLQLGFLHRNRHREFMLGPKVLSLGFAFLNGSQLRKLAETYIAEFSATHNWTVNLAVLDGEAIVFLYRSEAQRFLKYDLQAGSRLPSHCTGSGKVLLAALPDPVLRRRISDMHLTAMTSFTLVTEEALWESLMETRKRGHAVCDRELSLELYSIGVPVLNADGRVTAAVNVSVSAEDPQEKRAVAVERIRELGSTLSTAMGYEGPYPVIAPDRSEREVSG
jgi:IclR family pca regulon transcriptional regulator